MLTEYLRSIYDGKSAEINRDIWRLNYEKLSDAVRQSVGDLSKLKYGTADFDMAVGMLRDASRFATHKERKQAERISGLLNSKNGGLKSWEQFKKEAMPLAVQHNRVWLQTEYDQALSNAEMGKKWNRFKDSEELYPNLQYRAVMDARTRDEHAKLNGTILPLSDPFWRKYYPPNGWGCRCSVVQTDKPVSRPDLLDSVNPEQGFGFNPGIDKKIFADDSGYYQGWSKKESASIMSTAHSLFIRDLEKSAINLLKGKAVSYESLNVTINRTGIEKTRSTNKENADAALSALFNTDRLSRLMEKATYSVENYMKRDLVKQKRNMGVSKVHKWKSALYEICARENTEGAVYFYYIKLL